MVRVPKRQREQSVKLWRNASEVRVLPLTRENIPAKQPGTHLELFAWNLTVSNPPGGQPVYTVV